jgi:hypothetical protein
VGVQEFRLDKEGIVRTGNYFLFYGKRKRKFIRLEQDVLYNTEQNQQLRG